MSELDLPPRELIEHLHELHAEIERLKTYLADEGLLTYCEFDGCTRHFLGDDSGLMEIGYIGDNPNADRYTRLMEICRIHEIPDGWEELHY